ncbi:hypothetical protein PENSPDRAFT_571091 [Peniophora sp. CONT]|nr:hypothetical protein PENSPDRAFT_571091 [Peniophora sp. CONT]
MPPDYRAWHEFELALPQNNLELPYPQGKTGKYVRVSNHVTKLGWGNHIQEMIMNAHMSFESGRTFVFYNWTWEPNTRYHYTTFGSHYSPARIPITAYVEGPIAGGAFPPQDDMSPAVSWEFFDQACPNPTKIDVDPNSGELAWASARTISNHYADKIRNIDNHCVEFVSKSNKPIFDYILFGDGGRLSDVWEELIASPIVTEWTWSSLVMSIAEQNRDFIHPALESGASQRTPLSGLIALHIRRGDYPAHCKYLRKYHAPFHGFNQRTDFADHYPLPSNERWAADSQAYYDTHCIPDMNKMVEKVMRVRETHSEKGTLDRVYILTNGDRAWLREFEDALRAKATWASIHSSRELALSPEQKFVAQAADMMVATRAEVFVGNGFSSLTSTVNLLRVAQHRSPDTTRFW